MSETNSPEARFARLSQELMQDVEEAPTLQTVVDRSVETVGPCAWSAISFRRKRGRLETVASTDEVAAKADALQYTLGEGPCLDAAAHEDWYLSPDLATESRWPTWSPRAVDEGVKSVLSIKLSTMSETLGALNLYSDRAGHWTRDDVDLALVFAAHASNALGSARITSGLQIAIEGRHSIGVAQGMLMLRFDLTQQQSFELLRRLSSQHNTKLRDLAAQVVAARGLPAEVLATGDGQPH